jgi:hypothetical protein
MHSFKLLALGLSAALLVACGGGGGPLGSQNSNPDRGDLMQSPVPRIAGVSAAEFQAMLNADATGQGLLQLTGNPVCGVDVNYIKYGTVGGAAERTTASGVVMVPTGTDAQCTGNRPIVLYAHGTTIEKRYNLADWTDRTNPAFGESTLLAAMYAAQGYIVVAPNYAGYDSSSLSYHPYLNADQQSKEMIDILSAAKKALPHLVSATTASSQLFISGYSQGGHVAMATHRAMQTAGIEVTASAPLSGPYALAAQSDATFYGMVNAGGTVFSPMIFTSYQKAYGDIYTHPSDIYESAYATGIESLLPGGYNWTTLFTSGKLPALALFSSTAPTGFESAGVTPFVTGTSSDSLFAMGFGTGNLINNTARAAYLADAIANPDGVFPTVNGANPLAASNAGSNLRKASALNDLRGWAPAAPVLMCAGSGDPTVFYSLNTAVMQTLWTSNSFVTTLDVDSDASDGDPFAAVKAGFASAKAATLSAGGVAAVVSTYHGGLVPPFCAAAARGFFSQFLAPV